ncbi:MAG: 5-formyltetrahydrofolate cyclo-ligase [Pseudomonadota bacterium]
MTAESLADRKAALRTAAYARRKTAHQADGAVAALALRDHLLAGRFHTGATRIAGYRPIRTEIDPTPLMEALAAAGHRLGVPVIQGAGLPLIFREWWPGAPMAAGDFGAEIPTEGAPMVPDLILAPLVAFDRAGRRLGYGGGFYDRSLAVLRKSRRVAAIGLAYAAQEEAGGLPAEETDQPLDAIATEQGLVIPCR